MAKICFYSVATHLGGAERSLLEYLIFLKKKTNDEIDLLLPKGSGPLVEELTKNGISYTVFPMPKILLDSSRQNGFALVRSLFSPVIPMYLFSLVRYFRSKSPDLVYTTGIKCHLFGTIAAIFAGVPVLWHLRDHFSPGGTRFVLRVLYRLHRNTRAVANSHATALSLSIKHPPAVVYNGVAAADFPFSRSSYLRQELQLQCEKKIIGILGVLARWKGQKEFLRMAAILKERRNDLHFVVVGDQIYDTKGELDYKKELLQYAQTLGLEKDVSFLGFCREPAPILQSLDVLVHASIRPEPFGRVIIEAMACGTPVTASGAGGPVEIVRPGLDGLLHKPGDSQQMAENVERLLDENFSEKIRKTAHDRFANYFTKELYTADLHFKVSCMAANRANCSPNSKATAS